MMMNLVVEMKWIISSRIYPTGPDLFCEGVGFLMTHVWGAVFLLLGVSGIDGEGRGVPRDPEHLLIS